MYKIMIDSGHGGSDSGAISRKHKEKNINLSISRFILAHLIDWNEHHIIKNQSYPFSSGIQLRYPTAVRYEYEGYSLLFSRLNDLTVSLESRVHQANLFDADIFVSIHCNSSPSSRPRGTQVYYWHSSLEGTQLAINIFSKIEDKVEEFCGYKHTQWSGIKLNDSYYVLKHTNMPAVLVEAEFMSNPHGLLFLKLPENQNLIAQCIAEGIKGYLS